MERALTENKVENRTADTDTVAITIGLPVYNGENFLSAAIDSLLAQTFTDFELIIADNASTDDTEAISRAYASRDRRIRYCRSDRNLGAAWNFNRIIEMAHGRYFKWSAHDDVLEPRFLERCFERLEKNPSAVLCFSEVAVIDAEGVLSETSEPLLRIDSPNPAVRFHDMIMVPHRCFHVFGLIRTDILRRTAGIAPYTSSDRVLLGELSLYGPFIDVPERLFYSRVHEKQSTRVFPSRHERMRWFDTQRGVITFPQWRILKGILRSVFKSPLGMHHRARCMLDVLWYIWVKRRYLAEDLNLALRTALLCRPPERRAFGDRVQRASVRR
jgi:glycosyltransferase involved in cell wall biosynthesis